MGRTNPTHRDALSAIESRWQPYRRALRRRDRERFDRLFGYAREHADAAGTRNHRNPLVAALIGIVLEQERRLDEAACGREGLGDELEAMADRFDRIDGRLDRVEDRLDELEATVDAAALDQQLEDAGYRPAVTALANSLGDAELRDADQFVESAPDGSASSEAPAGGEASAREQGEASASEEGDASASEEGE